MKKGFTLIELMVTIAIIGLLAGIVLARFKDMRRDAEIAQIKANKKNIETALAMYMVKEEKGVESLFGDKAYDFKNFKPFYKYYSKDKLPKLPGTNKNLPLLKVGEGSDHNINLFYKDDSMKFGWYFSEEGNVYPLVSEDKYGIKWKEF